MQAHNKVMNAHSVRVIAVSGGKGGIGKTFVSINLAMALSHLGKRVTIFDADLGLANVDVLLNLKAKYDLSHVLSGECALEDIVLEGPHGISVIPASSGKCDMVELSPAQHTGIIHAFSDLSHVMDVLIVDTAAGISDSVIRFTKAAQEVLVVVCDEPASITDAYALIKILNQQHNIFKFRIIANMVKNKEEALQLFAKLRKVTDNFLDVALEFIGGIPIDENARKAIKKRMAVYDAYPNSDATKAFKEMANRVNGWPKPAQASGDITFFVEHLLSGKKAYS